MVSTGIDQNAVLQALAKALEPLLQKHTTPTGTPSTPYVHGPGGLFGVSGLEREVISTRVHPRGLAGTLPMAPSVTMNPLFPYLTGFRDFSGDVADGVCDDGPTAGSLKSCIQTAQFGRYTFMTRELEVNRVGQTIDRGEFMDLTLLNDPLVSALGGIFPSLAPQQQILAGREMLTRMVEVGVSFQNHLGRQTYIANPANNSGGGGYREFPGLDILIGINKVDALTGTDCPSLDSDIKDFNYAKVDDLNADVVNVLTYMMRYLRHNATTMGFDPVDWVLAMREELFYELTAVWACSYMTYRCTTRVAGQDQLVIDANDQLEMRDALRNGKYLLIDGLKVPVVTDDFVVEESSADTNRVDIGCFASDIYVIPLRVRSNIPATFWQYFNYQEGTIPAINDGRFGQFYWTDGGRYLWHLKPPLNWCVQQIAKIEPRIILRTPHLAGRLTNVQYCPLQHTRDAHPDDDYFTDGGVSTPRAAPSLYSDWNLP